MDYVLMVLVRQLITYEIRFRLYNIHKNPFQVIYRPKGDNIGESAYDSRARKIFLTYKKKSQKWGSISSAALKFNIFVYQKIPLKKWKSQGTEWKRYFQCKKKTSHKEKEMGKGCDSLKQKSIHPIII